jgi:NADH dehydrogenase (ubiquinone) Fe-S protein 1
MLSSVRQAPLLLGSCLSAVRCLSTSASALQQAAPQSDTIEVFVNDEAVNIPKGSTVLQACDAAGIDIPR